MDEIKSALFSIDPDCPREVWINVMFGLEDACTTRVNPMSGIRCSTSGPAPARRASTRDSNEVIKQWKSAKPNGGVTTGTLFAAAFASGWKRPLPDVTEMFKPIPPQEPYEDLSGKRCALAPRCPTVI